MQAILPTTGENFFNPSFSDFVVEAYARIQVRPPSFTSDHFYQARLSANLLLSDWSNVGMPILYKVQLLQIPLYPGVATYQLASNIIAPLDAFIRVYQTGTSQAQNFTPVFITTSGSLSVTVTQEAHGFAAGQMVWYPAPIAASGIIIQGPYIVTSVPDFNNYEITVTQTPDGSGSVALPILAAVQNQSLIAVQLPAHGLTAGEQFFINIPTMVGGVQLSGNYTVVSVPDANDFVIDIAQPVSQSQVVTMNDGLAQSQTQIFNVPYTDFILYPISRTDYASQPNKQQAFRPTTFWFDRTNPPSITFWNVPDNNGPYVLNLWVMAQPADVKVGGGYGVDGMPYRYFEAYAAGLAAKLARKYPPPPESGIRVQDLQAEAQETLLAALREDTERVPFYIQPGVWSYFQ
jgi:hypothetical protein